MIGCNDQKAEGAAKAEAAKAEAVKAERRQTIEGVMGFLKGEKFFVLQKAEDADWKSTHKTVIENFSYDEKENSLSFQMLTYSSHDARRYEEVGHAVSFLEDYKVNLSTASPVVSISDFTTSSICKGEHAPRAKKVTIKAKYSIKEVKKEGQGKGATASLQRAVSAIMTEVDLEKLKAKPWEEKKNDVEFVVTEDIAPRLKAALEDLLKANGVQVSKY